MKNQFSNQGFSRLELLLFVLVVGLGVILAIPFTIPTTSAWQMVIAKSENQHVNQTVAFSSPTKTKIHNKDFSAAEIYVS